MKILMTYEFKPNLLGVYAEVSTEELPTWNGPGAERMLTAKIYRHYPLTELEARSLHFKGSSPIDWIEKHLVQLVRLQAFDNGFDARYRTRAEIEILPGIALTQLEQGEEHFYVWKHDFNDGVMILTDNGIEIERKPVRGPQEYQSFAHVMASIVALADPKTEVDPLAECEKAQAE